MNSLNNLVRILRTIPFGQWFMIARTAKEIERNSPSWERETQRTIFSWQQQISSYRQKISYKRTELSYRSKEGEAVVKAVTEKFQEFYQIGDVNNVSGIINVGKNINNINHNLNISITINYTPIDSTLKVYEIPEFVQLVSKLNQDINSIEKKLPEIFEKANSVNYQIDKIQEKLEMLKSVDNTLDSINHKMKNLLSSNFDYKKLQEALGIANY